MITIELPLWLAIVIAIMLCLILLHLMFGDFAARLIVKLIKEKKDNGKED